MRYTRQEYGSILVTLPQYVTKFSDIIIILSYVWDKSIDETAKEVTISTDQGEVVGGDIDYNEHIREYIYNDNILTVEEIPNINVCSNFSEAYNIIRDRQPFLPIIQELVGIEQLIYSLIRRNGTRLDEMIDHLIRPTPLDIPLNGLPVRFIQENHIDIIGIGMGDIVITDEMRVKTLNEQEFDNLEKYIYDSRVHCDDGEIPICAVCQCDFEDEDEVTKLPCDHSFHTVCIKRWLTRDSCRCPNCRQDIECTGECTMTIDQPPINLMEE